MQEKKRNKIDVVNQIVKGLGGTSNIQTGTHCVSRFRLVVKNNSLVDKKFLEEIQEVKGVFATNGQIHIVLGAGVEEYFKILSDDQNLRHLKQGNKETIKLAGANKLPWYQKMMIHFSEIFIPLIPALVAGGLILGFRNILETNWGTENSPYSFVENSEFINGLNSFLWVPASAIFWYLPVALVWSVFRKMGGSPVLGIIIGLTLLVQLPNIYQVTGIAASKDLWIFNWILGDPEFQFGNWKWPIKMAYTAQVIPALLVAFVGVYIERWINKITPNVIKQIVVPLVTVLLAYFLAMFIVGPFGYVIGYGISWIISWAVINPYAKWILVPIFGLLYAPLVVTGLHHALNAVMIQNTSQLGGSFIFPILAISNIAQGAAIIGFIIKERKNSKSIEIGIPSLISAWLGVTEPAMYGVNLKKIYPFVAATIASSIGALLLTIFGITSNGIGSGGVFGILSIQAKSSVSGINTLPGTGFLWFAITMVVVISIAIILSYIFSKIKFFEKLEMKQDKFNV